MTLGKAAAAQVRLIVWWPASGRAGPGRDGCSVRRRHQRSRLAREACLFALRPTAGRYGRERDRASVGYGSNQIALASTGSSTDDAWYPSGCRLGVERGHSHTGFLREPSSLPYTRHPRCEKLHFVTLVL